jgi:hypothetical protein
MTNQAIHAGIPDPDNLRAAPNTGGSSHIRPRFGIVVFS